MSTHQSTVVMFGGTRSGKTSLLAETYLSANIALRRGSLEFSPDHASRVDSTTRTRPTRRERRLRHRSCEFAGVRPPRTLEYVLDFVPCRPRRRGRVRLPGRPRRVFHRARLRRPARRTAADRPGRILVVDAFELVNDHSKSTSRTAQQPRGDEPPDRRLARNRRTGCCSSRWSRRRPTTHTGGSRTIHAALHTAYAEMFATLREHPENTAVVVARCRPRETSTSRATGRRRSRSLPDRP